MKVNTVDVDPRRTSRRCGAEERAALTCDWTDFPRQLELELRRFVGLKPSAASRGSFVTVRVVFLFL